MFIVEKLVVAGMALVGIFFGVMLIFAPKASVRLNEILSRYIPVDPAILLRRFMWGIAFLLLGGFFLYMFYLFWYVR